jgi:chemotaxis protein CheC
MKNEMKEIEKDLLKEIVNIGLAKAADSLAMISKEKVLLTAPNVKFINNDRTADLVTEYSNIYTIIKSDILGDILGKTLILYTADHISKLSEVCLDKDYMFGPDKEEMELSLLLEISNILTGSLITQIANILHLHLYGSPPEAITDSVPQKMMHTLAESPDSHPFVFVVKTQFVNSSKLVDLPIILIFGLETIEKIFEVMRKDDAHRILRDN